MNRLPFKHIATAVAALSPNLLWAQADIHPSQIKSVLTEPVALFMVIIAILLLGVIVVLSRGIILGTDIYRKNKSNKNITLLALALLASPMLANAQEAAAEVAPAVTQIGGINSSVFYFLSGIIILEIIIILVLLSIFYILLGTKKAKTTEAAKEKKPHWIERFNAAPSVKGITDEELSMGHDFDGIEELDNPTPPWWRWGFGISVVFAVVYLWIYEISGTGNNQYQELALHTQEAEAAVKEYLAKSANNVDETTVTYLTDEGELAAGQAMFIQMCAACHANDGGGNEVGPNLTDKYWLHGGSIKDIFKTIKYGVPEKGMKSWKDDYSPKEIAQLASYVKSLIGTTPAQSKEPQGEIYEETEAPQEEAAASETALNKSAEKIE